MKKIWPLLLLLLLLIFLCTLQKMDTIKVTKGSIDFSIMHTKDNNKITGHFTNIKQKQVLKNLFKQLHAPVTLSSDEDNTKLADFGGIALTQSIARNFTKNYTRGEINYQNKVLTVKGKVKSESALQEMKKLLADTNITTKNLTVLDEEYLQKLAQEEAERVEAEKQKAEALKARLAAKKAKQEAEAKKHAQEQAALAAEKARAKAQSEAKQAALEAEKSRIEAEAKAKEAALEAERARLDAQVTAQKAAQEAEAQRVEEAEKTRLEAKKVALEAEERRKSEVEKARLEAEKARLEAEAASQKTALEAEEARKAKELTSQAATKKAAQEAEAKANIIKLLKVENIEFNTMKTTLTNRGKETVNKLSAILKKYTNIHIEIAGHTDSDGSEVFNQKLSQSRVDTVKKELASDGIDPTRLTANGYGESKPLVPNTNGENKQKNRRVEINILGE